MPRTRIAAISGSLRKDSYNTATLRAIQTLAPPSLEIDLVTLEDIPLFNEDVEKEGWPGPVEHLRDRVAPANGVLIATPEYNYSIPGVLKNALDWLSRPTGEGPVHRKPVAILGATPSFVGTARAQAHLRQVAFYNAMPLLPTEEALIAHAADKFDEDGNLTDRRTKQRLEEFLTAFEEWLALFAEPSGGARISR